MCGCLSHAPQLGTWPATEAMCPHGESSWQPFGSQAGAQSTEPHQPGQNMGKILSIPRFQIHISNRLLDIISYATCPKLTPFPCNLFPPIWPFLLKGTTSTPRVVKSLSSLTPPFLSLPNLIYCYLKL